MVESSERLDFPHHVPVMLRIVSLVGSDGFEGDSLIIWSLGDYDIAGRTSAKYFVCGSEVSDFRLVR